MAYDNTQPREGGILFRNDRKTNEKQPDWKGDYTLNGKKYDLAAWEKPTRNGGRFLSVKMSEPRPQAHQQNNQQADSIPF